MSDQKALHLFLICLQRETGQNIVLEASQKLHELMCRIISYLSRIILQPNCLKISKLSRSDLS